MENQIIDSQLQLYQSKIDELYKDLHQLTNDIGNESLSATVSDIRSKLNEPFMFVIVGEVKAGKSSFVNALLETGEEICKVAPDPCTDTVQQIVYGETQAVSEINPQLKKISLPVDILQKISIVDTPGTNTIADDHQTITEDFVPSSDLIVFVFECKNPYRQSAWEFFDFINTEWRKKIIFVLQQKDLMNEEDLAINKNGVIEQAKKKGLENPQVFCVSAKMELEGADEKESGFYDIRKYIIENITGGNAYKLKLQSSMNTANQISGNIKEAVSLRKKQYEADIDFRSEIADSLGAQADKSANRVDILVDGLLKEYDDVTGEIREEFKEGLGVGSLIKRGVSSIFSKDESIKAWLEEISKKLEEQLTARFQPKLDNGVEDIAESIRQMAKIVELKIKNNKTILDVNNEIFGDIANKRQETLQQLQMNFGEFVSDTDNFVDSELFPQASSLAPDIAMGGGLAVVGAILMTATHGMLLDITGGILSGLGLLLASFTILFKRKGVVSEFDNAIKDGRTRLKTEIESKLKAYIENIKNKLDRNFDPFDNHINREMKGINTIESELTAIDGKFGEIQKELA